MNNKYLRISDIFAEKNFSFTKFKQTKKIFDLKSIFFYFLLMSIFIHANVNAAPGKDGSVTISGSNTVVNGYARLASDPVAGTNTITVTSGTIANLNNNLNTTSTLGAGDLLLIIQMQGASISTGNSVNYGSISSYNNTGFYEFAYVNSVSGNTITLNCIGGLQHSYTASANVQVIRVPQPSDLTLTGSITAPAWNGQLGGIVAIDVQNAFSMNGNIDVSGLGFKGGALNNTAGNFGATGYVTTDINQGAEKGESIAGSKSDYDSLGGRYGRGAPANGGGGGNIHNTGGGGGANGNNGKVWTGQGIMCSSCTGNLAWTVDPGYIANGNALTDSSGGGRGGYSFTFSSLPNPITNANVNVAPVPPGTASNDGRREVGGLGGRPLNTSSGRIFFGGGGGAGDENNNAGSSGANGGGIVYITAGTVAGSGSILANGNTAQNTTSGHNDAPGGGGGGGSILLISATSISTGGLNANGGNGGNQLITNGESEGPGGGGGGGVILTSSLSTSTVSGGANGITTSASMVSFTANGSTSGAKGSISTLSTIPRCTATQTLSGKVFNDLNHNGIVDTGENGIPNIPVTLVDSSNVCKTINTDASGNYVFPILANNTYNIYENGANSSACPPPAAPPTNMGGTTPLLVQKSSASVSVTNVNFGNVLLSSQLPFGDSCPVDGYLSESSASGTTQLNSVDLSTNTKRAIGLPSNFSYNAIGFNTKDRFLYAMSSSNINNNETLRIDSQGFAVSLGRIPNLSYSTRYIAGDYNSSNNRFYIQEQGTSNIYAVNLATNTIDSLKNITLPSALNIFDIIFSSVPSTDGVSYIFATPSAGTGSIYRINPNTGASISIDVGLSSTKSYSAGFADPENNLYFEDNFTNLYKVSLDAAQTSGSVTSIITTNVPLSGANGARCPFARVQKAFNFLPDNTGNGSPGTTLTYPHEIYSRISGNVVLSSTSNQSGWSYTYYNDVNGNSILDAGDTIITNGAVGNPFTANTDHILKIIVKLVIPTNVPENTVDVLKLKATLTPTNTSISASSIIVQDITTVSKNGSQVLKLIKSVDKKNALPGDILTYTINYTNTGGVTLNNIEIQDLAPDSTDFQNANPIGTCTNTGVYDNTTKKIKWTIPSSLGQGKTGCVNFQVKIK